MDQTKTDVNDTSQNNGKESSPFSSGTTLTQSFDLFCNWSQVSSQVSDIKGLTFDPMMHSYSYPV